MNDIAIFNFGSHPVRIINIDPLNPLFVAVDVAKALGYKNTDDAIRRHCKRKTTPAKHGGGFYSVIPESDLYRLVFRSKLEAAEKFTDWVVEEVLPAIRKTGKYELPQPDTLTPAQQRHIQNRVAYLVRTQIGTEFSSMWRGIKDKFKVGSYKDIPSASYADVCEYLQCKPIHINDFDEEQISIADLNDPANADLKSALRSAHRERLLVVVENGRLVEVRNIFDYSLVPAKGYRTINRNLSKLQEQLQWLEGSRNDDVLEFKLSEIH